ncbi:LolA family protein [Flammeovirga kamogawensis]|uniref:Outer membrane lipoprotein carrier protein LolA n=1 Tax=Flammeovirga kamogawensis TaxID=373891 RepID=A0ABX8GU91_9BACT|nr:outer membrane lipoprotein carrier protein LolA [Flammeovirga kamogawensis]MBB6459772.1 outer membrane lipoprotein-sorting protein [Flammeovirga kamogawensis]QWG07170.1 outer membrane lipoprotein carrier protein LolA [Flammeovirga kamogawensis]TRX68992.1 outer membrane lipoprotein carrier protein LolA [Flammeovirga kamogawensis]
MIKSNKNILSFLFILVLSIGNLFAQQDEKAEKILDQMSTFYKGLNSFSADINQEAISTTDGTIGDIQMKAIVSGNKYQLQLDGQTIYNDTKTVSRYDQEMEEVTLEEADAEDTDVLSSPAQIYSIYEKNFKYLYIEKDAKGNDIIDLSPDKSLEVNFFKIRMHINPKTHALVKFVIFEKGNLMRYENSITNFKQNVSVSDSEFVFDTAKYPDAEVVDLR